MKVLSTFCRCWEYSIYGLPPTQNSLLTFIINWTRGCGCISHNLVSVQWLSATEAVSKLEGGVSCMLEVQKALPILKKAYGDSMRKVLHIGPETCTVVSELLKEEDTEAWGVEPYELDDADSNCKNLVHKGIVASSSLYPTGYPGQHRAKATELSKFGRPAKLRSSTWWIRFLLQTSIEENEAATKKFEQAATKISYKPACQVFHLKSRH
ncbi:putative pectin methylesterase CGR3 [Camellia lanceoleosa]|uniref:Pectin methylesterase CGR3 n=1 Tax=Camellia lanceoleosa TaxID=1840588 RepID=A0ACC0IJL9_9ERIC|nr:putative pectin methylesterase CGR3 [Camellia lanceoleosa]